MSRNKGYFEPTIASIRNGCKAIQEKWSDEERDKRARHLASSPIVEIKNLTPVWSELNTEFNPDSLI